MLVLLLAAFAAPSESLGLDQPVQFTLADVLSLHAKVFNASREANSREGIRMEIDLGEEIKLLVISEKPMTGSAGELSARCREMYDGLEPRVRNTMPSPGSPLAVQMAKYFESAPLVIELKVGPSSGQPKPFATIRKDRIDFH